MLKKIFKRKQTCQTDSLQIQTACILTKTFTGMRPAHTTIQYFSSPILVTWSSSIVYNQLNSSHLGGSGVEGVGQVILIILIMWLVRKITLLVWE